MSTIIRDSSKRRTAVAIAVGVGAVFAILAALLRRQSAATDLAFSVGLLVLVEFIYSMNMWMGRTIFGRGSSRWYRTNQAVGGLLFGSLAIAGLLYGLFLLVRG
jgi:type III secretory pathway component EscS